MKLSSINNIKYQNINLDDKKNYNSKNINPNHVLTKNQNNDVSFTGLTSFLVKFWQWVENGGRALSFTVEDMGGTNFPRLFMGMFAGFRYTHKINMDSLKQEGIREFLTGPTMTFMPMAILAGMKTLCGNSADTHIENLNNLSYLAKDSISENGLMDDKAFVNKVVQDLLEKTTNKKVLDGAELTKDDVSALSELILSYKNIIADTKLDKKESKRLSKDILNKAQEMFSQTLKRTKDSYDGCDFLTASYSVNDVKNGSTKFKDYVGYIANYVNDFATFTKDKVHNLDSEGLLTKFKNNYIGKRVLTIACMFVITGKLMSYIPRLYTWASGGINPNAKNIYNEASKNNSGGVK